MATRLQYLKSHALVHDLQVCFKLIYCYKSEIKIQATFYENKKLDA